MIYLKDEKTGLTLEDIQPEGWINVQDRCGLDMNLKHDEANALLRGLLRWKLDKEGVLETELFFDRVVVQLNRERSR